MSGLSFVIMAPGGDFDAALESRGDLEVRARVERLDDLVTTVVEKRPDALLVGLEHEPREVFEAVEKLLAPRPLLFFHGPDDTQLILQAMRFGAREYVAPAPDATDQLLAAVERVARETGASGQVEAAPLIAVLGAKGGVGTSFVACQLAACLARLGGRTALVDGQLRRGDVALYLDLSPPYTFASLASHSDSADSTYLHSVLTPHASGVQVLAAPRRPEEADVVGVECVEGVVDLLRADFDWVICDTPGDFDDRSLFILDQADPILLITTPDVPAMNHTREQLELLERLGHSLGRIRIVVNRTEARASISAREAKEFLHREIDASIPNDYRRASACLNEGRTIHDVAPRSPLGQALPELACLAHSWCDRSPPPSTSRRGLLDRLSEMALFDRLRGK
jgi:pilus assembly protein CpaE